MEVSGQSLALKIRHSFRNTSLNILKRLRRSSKTTVVPTKQNIDVTKEHFSIEQAVNPAREEIERLSICIQRKKAWLMSDSMRDSNESTLSDLDHEVAKCDSSVVSFSTEAKEKPEEECLGEREHAESKVLIAYPETRLEGTTEASSQVECIYENKEVLSLCDKMKSNITDETESTSKTHQEVVIDQVIISPDQVKSQTKMNDCKVENVAVTEAVMKDKTVTSFKKIKPLTYSAMTHSCINKHSQRVDYLSKSKSVRDIENKLKSQICEAQKLSFRETPMHSSQILLMALEECLKEISKHSVIWGETLLQLSLVTRKVKNQVSSFDNLLEVFQMDNTKMTTEIASLKRFAQAENILILEKELEEEKLKNLNLTKLLSDLEDISLEDRTTVSSEKAKRRKAETDLMLVSIEAGVLKKKLTNFLEGGTELDPHLLQIALNKCSEKLSQKTKRLQDIELHYKEVVPKSELDRCQKRLTSILNFHDKLTTAHDRLKEKHEAVVEAHETVCTERDQLCNDNDSLRRSATPRPDWNRVAEHVEGGITRWHEMALGRTSDQLLDVVISELTGTATTESSAEFLSCQGTDKMVLAFLRYEGCVRNKRLNKRDVLLLIQDVWKERRKSNSKISMDEFLDQYFRERYHLYEIRVEWCYSLADACQRLAHEEQIGLFWGIVCGQVQEEIYHFQENTISALHDLFIAKDTKKKGIIAREMIDEIVSTYFPLKTEAALEEIKNIIRKAASVRDPSLIKYRQLFVQDEHRLLAGTSRLPLAKVLIRQAREEQEVYVSEILREFKPSAVDVSVAELRRAFTIVDPLIEQNHLNGYISWVFNAQKEDFGTASPVSLPLLVARLQTGHVVRIGKRS